MIPALALSFGEIILFLVSFALAMTVTMAIFALVIGEVSSRLPIPPAHVLSVYMSYLAMVIGVFLIVWGGD